jgi:hypothetical protein
MIRTLPAIIDKNGDIRLVDPIKLDSECRALVTIMDEEHAGLSPLACERTLSEWILPEEDNAWMHLQPGSSS